MIAPPSMSHGDTRIRFTLYHSQSMEDISGNCSQALPRQSSETFFFCERVIAAWNSLNTVSDDLRSVNAFRRQIVCSDLSSLVY